MAKLETILIGFLGLEGDGGGIWEGIAPSGGATKAVHFLLDMMTPQKREVKVEVEEPA